METQTNKMGDITIEDIKAWLLEHTDIRDVKIEDNNVTIVSDWYDYIELEIIR